MLIGLYMRHREKSEAGPDIISISAFSQDVKAIRPSAVLILTIVLVLLTLSLAEQ